MYKPEQNVQLMINGMNVSVPKGSTVLEAARKSGIVVPTLCYDEEITSFHSCRICIVEIEGRGLEASCSTEAAPGMVVYTDSETVVKSRKIILELLLANHPDDCLVCDSAGSCKLQNYAYWYKVDADRFQGKRKQSIVDSSSPFIYRDQSKCILCGKCVRVCEEMAGKHSIDFAWRGFETSVTPPLEVGLEETDCVQCGNCVAVCPVGALTEKTLRGKGRSWEFSKVSSICPYCGVGCSIDLTVRFGKVIGVTSEEDAKENGAVNGRFMCAKGRFGHEFIHHKDRIKQPHIRKNGELVPVSWAEAVEHVAARFKNIKDGYGSNALSVMSSARCTNEENYLASKFARTVFETNNIDHCARLCHASSIAGLGKSFGSGAMTNSVHEIEHTDFILAVGSNATETHPVIGYKIRKAVKNGTILAVIDPRKTELAEMADFHAQLEPGTDIALLNSIASIIIKNNWVDYEFLDKCVEGFDEFKGKIEQYSSEWAEKITGVPAHIIENIAEKYAAAPTGMILYTMGITQHSHGTNNVLSVANLAMLTGKIGRERCGVNPLRGQNNVQGACDMGALPNVLSGYQKIKNPKTLAKFEEEWKCSLPAQEGLTLGEMFKAAHDGELKAMYIIGENPLVSDANLKEVRAALEKLEFLVVQDLFFSETALLADVILPASGFAEKEGTFTNTERRVQLLNKAIDPVENSKPDWVIICDIASAMGYNWDYSSAEDIMREIALLTPSYRGIQYSRLKESGIQWPCPDTSHEGTQILYTDGFKTDSGKGKLHAAAYISPGEERDEDFPFVLITGRRLFHYHTGTMTRKVEGLNDLLPSELVQINFADARDLGVESGQKVKIKSRRGEVSAKIEVTDIVPKGAVFASFHFDEVLINKLTSSRVDPEAKIPELKRCAVNLEKES